MMDNAGTLTTKTARDGPICVLTLSGDLDFLAVTDFLVHAARVVDLRAERLVLDLAGLTFLDCAGARALAIVTHFVPSGCPVIIRSLSPPARQTLDLLGLDLGHVRQEPSTCPEHHDTRMQPGASDPARTR
jgi:anti-anti-sigma factor